MHAIGVLPYELFEARNPREKLFLHWLPRVREAIAKFVRLRRQFGQDHALWRFRYQEALLYCANRCHEEGWLDELEERQFKTIQRLLELERRRFADIEDYPHYFDPSEPWDDYESASLTAKQERRLAKQWNAYHDIHYSSIDFRTCKRDRRRALLRDKRIMKWQLENLRASVVGADLPEFPWSRRDRWNKRREQRAPLRNRNKNDK